jgi:hypothetical protein
VEPRAPFVQESRPFGCHRRHRVCLCDCGSAGSRERASPDSGRFCPTFEEQFAKADKISPYVILEMVGRLYWLKGGTPEAWCVYLESIGVKVAAQSRNLFISFLRFICGSHPDRSHRLGKLAQALAYWASIVRPTPDGCDPDPEPQREIWGTSQFTRWALDLHGYTAVAEKWRETSADASAGEPDGELNERITDWARALSRARPDCGGCRRLLFGIGIAIMREGGAVAAANPTDSRQTQSVMTPNN